MVFTNKHIAAGALLAMTVGMAMPAFSADNAQVTPDARSMVTTQAIDQNSGEFANRLDRQVVERQAPQAGQTRADIEAIYGPSQQALAPGKDYDIYTNEMDLVEGKMFRRQISENDLKVYEVTYATTNGARTATDKATDVKVRVIPRIGDHRNLVTKLLGAPMNTHRMNNQSHMVYGIPKGRYQFYSDVLSSPFEAVNAFFNSDGFLVGQEFMPSNYQGQTVLTSAGRYVEFDTNYQPDRKVGW